MVECRYARVWSTPSGDFFSFYLTREGLRDGVRLIRSYIEDGGSIFNLRFFKDLDERVLEKAVRDYMDSLLRGRANVV